PNMTAAIEGMVNLRGEMVPVIHLPHFCGIVDSEPTNFMIATEFNQHVQGLLVCSVDNIRRVSWDDVKSPPPMLSANVSGLVTAVTKLPDGRLVMILDVEKILAETADFYKGDDLYEGIKQSAQTFTVLFADDSSVARTQIEQTLRHMKLDYISTTNGKEAWNKLQELAGQAEARGVDVSSIVSIVLTDVEMPEMDGYVLTRKIRADARFSKVRVVMHSSLSAETNKQMGMGVGADAYVAKFKPLELSAMLHKIITDR
ncbi:MAG TPA: chemotaxis signal transduction protein CheV, partial [Gammaproteobacteria bacterium]|nr:chemotaxis signal transduction protein CheV [Gammaproteobacteria bacterium]